MVASTATIEGGIVRYAISDNADDPGPWAVNLHGFFAGGGMYWRESARLAGGLGWRVLNPSLPAFGGSSPLPWSELSVEGYADRVVAMMDHVGVGQAVVLGHSMGGLVAMAMADRYPDRVLGVVYRDGAGPSSWRDRHGLLATVLNPVAPDAAAFAEIVMGAVADVGDMAIGRAGAMVRGLWGDARLNFSAVGDTMPVAAMLLGSDIDDALARVGAGPVPVLPVWGRYDRLIPTETGRAFGDIVGQRPVWVRGGHSWMLPRPATQLRILRRHPAGMVFAGLVDDREQAMGRPRIVAR